MNQYLKIRTNDDDGVIIISNKRGFSAKELYGILAFAQTIITTASSVTMDVFSKTETDIKEIRIDDVGISFYDTIT